MQAKFNQISFTDIYANIENFFEEDKPKLIKLLEETIDLSEYIPQKFYNQYYKSTGHPRDFKLSSMLSALIVQKILSISETSLLINILKLSKELRDFCGFTRVPDDAQLCRFKKLFLNNLNNLFQNLVNITEPILKTISPQLADILIADTTGIEGNVKENNPEFFDSILRVSKQISKNNPDFNYHSYACSRMPKIAFTNNDMKLSYINGHYCYSIKVAVVTDGLGIIRHIDFYDTPSIDIADALSANEAKDDYDAKTLIPILKNYFSKHPDFKYTYFLGDAGFDAVDNYKYLVKEHNIIPIIPINKRNSKDIGIPGINEDGIPTCPCDPDLPMKFDGIDRSKNRPIRLKWLCPKTIKVFRNHKVKYICSCENPCTTSSTGRIHHTYPDHDYRINTVVPRNSEKWNALFKLRTIIERSNYMIKYPLCVANSKLRDTDIIKADLLLACITQQIIVILASKINEIKHPLSIKSLVA